MPSLPKILIVDDEPFNRDYLEQELEDLEYTCLCAADGQQALQLLRAEAPDLVLLDIMMPVMNGFEVLARIKGDPATQHIPVIVISAVNDLESVVRGIQQGAEDYLPKPFEPALLQARIAASLEKKRLRDLQAVYLKSLERELEIGRQIQIGFLPGALPAAAGWEIAAFFQAAREVSGDFYDSFRLPDDKIALVVGDVCGKGVGAALFMTLFRSLLRAAAITDRFTSEADGSLRSPAERLLRAFNLTNNYIEETHAASNMFATVFFGILDPEDGRLTYINGGNEPPLLLSASGITRLAPSGPVLGVIPAAQYEVRQARLEPGDALLVFTDGIPDTLSEEAILFGQERLLELVRDPTCTAAELIELVRSGLESFIGAADQFDDITLLVVKRV